MAETVKDWSLGKLREWADKSPNIASLSIAVVQNKDKDRDNLHLALRQACFDERETSRLRKEIEAKELGDDPAVSDTYTDALVAREILRRVEEWAQNAQKGPVAPETRESKGNAP